MDSFFEDFDAFFNQMSGSSSGTPSTNLFSKGTRPPLAPDAKTKSQESSLGGLRSIPASRKRKFGSSVTLVGDPVEGSLILWQIGRYLTWLIASFMLSKASFLL